MVFPSNLVYVTLFHTLHEKGKTRTKDQLKLFAIVFAVIFVYQVCRVRLIASLIEVRASSQVFPTVLFPTLNSLAILCKSTFI